MNESSIFTREIQPNKSPWILLGLWAVLRSVCELLFLGILRDYATLWTGKESVLGLGLLETLLALALSLLFRYLTQTKYLSQSMKMKASFRQQPIYLNLISNTWATQREKQQSLDLAYDSQQLHLSSWLHLAVFLPAILINDMRLFILFLACFAPIIALGNRVRKPVKNSASEYLKKRDELFLKISKAKRFQEKWTHSALLNKTKIQIDQWMQEWSAANLHFQEVNEKSKLKIEFINSIALVLLILFLALGVKEHWFDPSSIFFFITAVLVSYEPMKKLQIFKNTQLESETELDQSYSERQDGAPFTGEIQIRENGLELKNGRWVYDQPLFDQPINQLLPNGIHFIQGANGVGKSSLLNSVVQWIGTDEVILLDQFPLIPPFDILSESWMNVDAQMREYFGFDIPIQDQDYSGGETQKLLTLLTLTQDAKWFLLDEPFANVDLAQRAHWYDLLSKWAKQENLNLMVVHHDLLNESEEFVNQWFLSQDGLKPC